MYHGRVVSKAKPKEDGIYLARVMTVREEPTTVGIPFVRRTDQIIALACDFADQPNHIAVHNNATKPTTVFSAKNVSSIVSLSSETPLAVNRIKLAMWMIIPETTIIVIVNVEKQMRNPTNAAQNRVQ
jgi:hypothetical protein